MILSWLVMVPSRPLQTTRTELAVPAAAPHSFRPIYTYLEIKTTKTA
jgi:hypothetical protein